MNYVPILDKYIPEINKIIDDEKLKSPVLREKDIKDMWDRANKYIKSLELRHWYKETLRHYAFVKLNEMNLYGREVIEWD